MLLLMTFLGRPTDNESQPRYQRDEWGTLNSETCMIELSAHHEIDILVCLHGFVRLNVDMRTHKRDL